MNKDIKVLALLVLQNAICILAFTLLAIAFHKWWIILFAFIFFESGDITIDFKEGSKNDERKNSVSTSNETKRNNKNRKQYRD